MEAVKERRKSTKRKEINNPSISPFCDMLDFYQVGGNNMLSNFHTHTTFCDGKNSAEEIVLYAIDKGFDCIGFSGHGYTPFDLTYCMKDIDGYIKEIKRLKEKYKAKIQIYLGLEEDAFSLCNRGDFEYIIGSSHYFCVNGEYYPVDSDYECLKKCIKAFDDDILKLAGSYYSAFVKYILDRKPDIVGHFDLITKFDEIGEQVFLNNQDYLKLSEKYIQEALKSDALFEVNTGAIARGFRKTPYPYENLLNIINKSGGKIILSSDCHEAKNLDFHFEEARKYLYDIGFRNVYVLHDNTFKKEILL